MMPPAKIAATLPRHARGVLYSPCAEMPGVEMFRCEKWRSTLTVAACGKRWLRQRDADVEHRDACYGCALGACHAGVEPDRRSRLFGLPICNRCRHRSPRMIFGRLCISCSNRAWEWRRGRNARGRRPGLVLEPARIGLVINPGEAGEIVLDIAEMAVRDRIELAIGALRVVDGSVAITRPRGGAAIDLAELARRHGARKPPRKPMPRRHVMPRTGT